MTLQRPFKRLIYLQSNSPDGPEEPGCEENLQLWFNQAAFRDEPIQSKKMKSHRARGVILLYAAYW